MVEVSLYAKTCTIGQSINTEAILNTIASQSRNRTPKDVDGLFKRTLEWGHDSIQEFVDYVFWIQDVSRTLLAQLTRHRMASYNVSSHRHVPPNKATLPDGIRIPKGRMYFEDDTFIEWEVLTNGDFVASYNNKQGYWVGIDEAPVPLEDIRMFFPSAVTVNLFMKMNGRSLRNFLKLRMATHAQWEIRELAHQIYDIVKADCPALVDKL